MENNNDETENRLGHAQILQLLNFSHMTYLIFDGTMDEQVKGTPIGSPISKLIAEMVLQRLESLAVGHHRPKFRVHQRNFTRILIYMNASLKPVGEIAKLTTSGLDLGLSNVQKVVPNRVQSGSSTEAARTASRYSLYCLPPATEVCGLAAIATADGVDRGQPRRILVGTAFAAEGFHRGDPDGTLQIPPLGSKLVCTFKVCISSGLEFVQLPNFDWRSAASSDAGFNSPDVDLPCAVACAVAVGASSQGGDSSSSQHRTSPQSRARLADHASGLGRGAAEASDTAFCSTGREVLIRRRLCSTQVYAISRLLVLQLPIPRHP
ncbi:hypothetical protein SprV_0100113200 [Sparganum proliferum]